MRLGWLCLGMVSLLGGAGFAGEPVALGGHTLRGAGRLRIDAHGGAARAAPVQEQAELIVRLGPSGDCIWPLRADELFFSLAGGYSFLLGTGSWGVDGKGRMALALDSHAFEGELRDASFRDGAGLRVDGPVDYDCGDDDGGIIIIGPRPR
jgi:hypothetical protein